MQWQPFLLLLLLLSSPQQSMHDHGLLCMRTCLLCHSPPLHHLP
jgi:hypothetical protein